MKLTKLVKALQEADAALPALQETKTRLEAEYQSGLASVKLDGPLPPELVEVGIKLQAIPLHEKATQARITELEDELRIKNEHAARALSQFGSKQETALKAKVVSALKPMIADIESREALLHTVLTNTDEYRGIYDLQFASSIQHGASSDPFHQGTRLIALAAKSGFDLDKVPEPPAPTPTEPVVMVGIGEWVPKEDKARAARRIHAPADMGALQAAVGNQS